MGVLTNEQAGAGAKQFLETVVVEDTFDSAVVVSNWLTNHGIEHTREQRFEGLMGDYTYLRMDIWIPSKNVCIEVDGQLHYQISCNESVEKFLKKRRYARKKELFCLQHGILLVRVVYDELSYLDETLGFLLNFNNPFENILKST